MPQIQASDDLLPRVARGDQAAVAGCLDRYGGLVWSLASRVLGKGPEAEDVTQEIFVELWRLADRFDPAKAKESTFVAMIARRRVIDRVRKQAKRPAVESIEHADLAASRQADLAERDEEIGRVNAVMNDLPKEQASALRLTVCDGLSHGEAANRLNLPLGTVKSHVRRGLLKLKEKLGVRPEVRA